MQKYELFTDSTKFAFAKSKSYIYVIFEGVETMAVTLLLSFLETVVVLVSRQLISTDELETHKDYLKRYYGKNTSYPQALLSAERPYWRSNFKI